MKKLATLSAALGAATAIALALAGTPQVAQANHLCGTTALADVVLAHNHTCAGPGIKIGADGVTVNLNGYVLKGSTTTTTPTDLGIDNLGGWDDVTVEKGVIEGFYSALFSVGGVGLYLSKLTITGDRKNHAVEVKDSEDFQIKNSFITIPNSAGTPWWIEALRLEGVDGIWVKRVDFHGGFVGVNFACGDCDNAVGGSEPPTNGKVEESVFHDLVIGVLIANSTKAKVERNKMVGGINADERGAGFSIPSKGISGDADFLPGSIVTGVKIRNNHIYNNHGLGIRLKGVTDSEVKGNKVHLNDDEGIGLFAYTDGDTIVHGSTDNKIKDNTSTGNGGDDMFADTDSSPNQWKKNQCATKGGGSSGDIDCP